MFKKFKKEKQEFTLPFEKITIEKVGKVGGKNASLGEMIKYLKPKGVRIPSGFAITADSYRYFLEQTGLKGFIAKTLDGLDTKNLKDLSRRGKIVREKIRATQMPKELKSAITAAYGDLEKEYGKNPDVAVRSSATAEDLPGASFAGEHETFLHIKGAEQVINASRASMASLFTDRAISYRQDKGFSHFDVALSVGVQKMIRSDLACAGVMFTLDTESGFPGVILINGAWGLGELIVQGEVTPDEFLVFKKTGAIINKRLGKKNQKIIYGHAKDGNHMIKKVATDEKERDAFVLTDKEILELADWGQKVEDHYTRHNKKWTPMDMEWAKDGESGKLFMVQARPETVHASRDYSKVKEYERKGEGKLLVKGASVGSKIATGKARVILETKDLGQFQKGEILITTMTDPDWEPIMKIASAIVTDKGGRTSHAAIVSRELGIPCIVGSEFATKTIKTGDPITVDTTGTEGLVLKGILKFNVIEHDIKKMPKVPVDVMMNIATPGTAFEKSFLPNDGVGLAREEFIIASDIGIHPNALLDYEKFKKGTAKEKALANKIDEKTVSWKSKTEFYVDNLAYGIAQIGAAFYPKHVIVRFSDFKTNEYRTLLGGEAYEPVEENPMIGWRGASRYYDPKFKDAFVLECRAFAKVRKEMGLMNVFPMVPFCRTVEEGEKTVAIMAAHGLDRKKDKELKIYVMCEIPSNVLLADEFLDVFDGMSIGSNDLTQLTLGIDRDSGIVRHVANENNESVKKFIAQVIKICNKRRKYIGICGQAPSDYPDFAKFLVERGIKSISLNPDVVVKTRLELSKMRRKWW
jgi:pyruvate,water dikinase